MIMGNLNTDFDSDIYGNLNVAGYVMTILTNDLIDEFIGGTLSYIEEIISGIATVYNSIILGEIIGELITQS